MFNWTCSFVCFWTDQHIVSNSRNSTPCLQLFDTVSFLKYSLYPAGSAGERWPGSLELHGSAVLHCCSGRTRCGVCRAAALQPDTEVMNSCWYFQFAVHHAKSAKVLGSFKSARWKALSSVHWTAKPISFLLGAVSIFKRIPNCFNYFLSVNYEALWTRLKCRQTCVSVMQGRHCWLLFLQKLAGSCQQKLVLDTSARSLLPPLHDHNCPMSPCPQSTCPKQPGW